MTHEGVRVILWVFAGVTFVLLAIAMLKGLPVGRLRWG